MKMYTVMFGKIDVPETEEEIQYELQKCKERFYIAPTRYLQSKIDCLESALDNFRRMNDKRT